MKPALHDRPQSHEGARSSGIRHRAEITGSLKRSAALTIQGEAQVLSEGSLWAVAGRLRRVRRALMLRVHERSRCG